MRFRTLWWALLAFLGCTSKFVDTTIHGVPNISQYAPNLWRMGQPTDNASWDFVRSQIQKSGKLVLDVKLDDEVEGNDDYAEKFPGWTVLRLAIPPEDDKIWTVFVKPDQATVSRIVRAIIVAHNEGWVVVHHCVHGRDRTSLIAALVGMKLFGWTKQQAWDDMLAHGFRWELPDLDAFWIEDVDAKPLPN